VCIKGRGKELKFSCFKGDVRMRYAYPKLHKPTRLVLINHTDMGLKKLIGKGPQCLVPAETHGEFSRSAPRATKGKQGLTKHTSPRAQKMRRSR